MKTLCLAVLAMALCVPAAAQADHGQRFNYTAFTMSTAARTFDTYQSCRLLAIGGHEAFLPTQSCAGVASINAGFVLGGIGAHILAHKTGHHKWESVGHALVFTGSVVGIAYSTAHWKSQKGIF